MGKILVRMPIEVDVTYVNKTWFTLRKKSSNAKHYVIGFFQREGKAIIKTLINNDPITIKKAILENVSPGSILYAEENILPESLKTVYEVYEMGEAQTDKGVHIAHVKNMWKDLKRNLKQVHIQVSKKHLQLYCSEVEWRINHRHLSSMEKFNLVLSNVSFVGHRPYKKLIE